MSKITKGQLKAAYLDSAPLHDVNPTLDLIDQLFTELEQLRGKKPDYYECFSSEYTAQCPNQFVDHFGHSLEVGQEIELRAIMPLETYIVTLIDGKKVAVLKEGV